MNRKNADKDAENEETAIQVILPKFVPNWISIVRFDRIVMNVSGNIRLR